jgi:hypothetical protein
MREERRGLAVDRLAWRLSGEGALDDDRGPAGCALSRFDFGIFLAPRRLSTIRLPSRHGHSQHPVSPSLTTSRATRAMRIGPHSRHPAPGRAPQRLTQVLALRAFGRPVFLRSTWRVSAERPPVLRRGTERCQRKEQSKGARSRARGGQDGHFARTSLAIG